MKLLRVTFRSFGPFKDQLLDFSESNALQIVFGENEAGKSSALRGILAFLFGFHGQSKDNFQFQHKEFRVHALLERLNGQKLECIRRKGNKDTLRKSCDKDVMPERQLSDFLGGLNSEQFEQLFGLDADRLRIGGQAMVQSDTKLQSDSNRQFATTLFEAGAGMKGLRELSNKLANRLQELYRSGGKNQAITVGLRELRDLRKQGFDQVLSPDTYRDAVAAAESARIKVAELIQERVAVRTERDLLNRYKAALPTIDLLRTARERLVPVADAPILSPDFDVRLEAARNKSLLATKDLEQLDGDRTRLTDAMTGEEPPSAMLREEGEVSELKKLVGADIKSREEELKATAFSIDELGKARDIFRELTGSKNWDQMGELKPTLDERNRITRLTNERSAIVEDATRREKEVAETKRQLAAASDNQKKLTEPPDPSPWQAIVDEIAAAGPLEIQHENLRTAVQTEESRLVDDFKRMNPAPPGTWQEAPALPVPLAETVESFRQEFESARSGIDRIGYQQSEAEKEIVAIQNSLVGKVGTEPVPTVDGLTAARSDRDSGMHCIRLRLAGQGNGQVESEFTRSHAPGRLLIDAAESSIRHCDTLADRLRHEADRVAVFQTLQQQLKNLRDDLDKLNGEEKSARTASAYIEQCWQAAWQPTGISPSNPIVMQTWLTNWARFVERVAKWQTSYRQCETSEQQIETLRSHLATTCPVAAKAKSLAQAITFAKRAIAEASLAKSDAVKLENELGELRSELRQVEDDEAIAKARLDRWKQEWSQAVKVLRVNESSPTVETAQDYLKRIDEMQLHLRDMRLKDARIREIKNERNHLIERVHSLRLRLDPNCTPTTADSLDADFRKIELELHDAIVLGTRHKEYAKRLCEIDKRLEQTRKNLAEASASLQVLALEARVEIESIPVAVQRARERAETAQQTRQYEEALALCTLGEPAEEFIESALAHREQLGQRLDELGRRVELLDPLISSAEAESLDASRKVDVFNSASAAAAGLHQSAELLATKLKDQIVEYAAHHLALTALERAKDRYRTQNQDTLLNRAGEYFENLTDGAFSGIDIDNDDGTDVLVAVRATQNRPDTRVGVSGLSDGTRDQLFLALRLAGIEHHLKDREPVPLIVDDVLVNFDDRRAKATFKCLGELASKTQIIIFTHHAHLVEIARSVDPSTPVHTLGPRA